MFAPSMCARANGRGSSIQFPRKASREGTPGILFLPIGSPAHDFYGGDRKGQNLYGNSLVALEAATGKLLWYYQFVPHDISDCAPPVPITVKRPCRPVAHPADSR